MTLQVTITQGLTFGSVYALSALGFAILYNTTGVFHIAYGAFAILGFMIAVTLNTSESAVPLIGSVLVGIAAVFVVTIVTFGFYNLLARRGLDRLGIFVVSLGIAIGTQALMQLAFGPAIRTFNIPSLARVHSVAGFPFSALAWIAIGSAVVIFALVTGALRRTRWGYRVRGIASNPELAQLVGTRTGLTMTGVYAVAAICSVWAAVLLGMLTTQTSADGTNVVLLAAIATIAAGRGTYAGGFLVALALGFVQPAFSFYISETWAPSAVFGIALVLLLIRPAGLSRAGAEAQR
ncbi:MAG: branched-chain amino acid ABC transporter permease [Solirubrobacterales bacterium]|nr:branched-chain amino acid ABC transporter permease [Solirubrobacterales bacterium]